VADLFVKGLNFVAYFQADVVVGATLLAGLYPFEQIQKAG
jgi:hypothetical protein